MAQIHLRKARKHLQLVHKPDGSIDWATAPLLPQVNRSNKFRELWPKTNPDLGSMPTEILENIARNLMAHTTRLVPVSKRDVDDARNAASVRAQYDAANQEVTRLLHKDRLTRSEAKRRAELHRITCDMSAKVDRSDSLRRLGYQFFDSPLFKINNTIRSAARTALIEVNEFSLRPEVLFSNEDWWSKEGSVPNMRFDELSEQILINSPRIEVIVHWYALPILQGVLLRRQRAEISLEILQVTIVGKIPHFHDAETYTRLLRCIPAESVLITWSPGYSGSRRNPPIPAREVTWPELRDLFDDVEDTMVDGGLTDVEKGTRFVPFRV